jgi:hypothetical protein
MKRNTVFFLIFLKIVILFVVYYSICTKEGLSEKEKALSDPVEYLAQKHKSKMVELQSQINTFLKQTETDSVQMFFNSKKYPRHYNALLNLISDAKIIYSEPPQFSTTKLDIIMSRPLLPLTQDSFKSSSSPSPSPSPSSSPSS